MAPAAETTKEAIVGVVTAAKVEPFANVAGKFREHRETVLAAFASTDFYIQLIFIGVALGVAWLMAMLIRRHVRQHLEKHPPRIDIEFITKPLSLLGPLLAIIYLAVVKPFADEFAADGGVAGAMIHLSAAYFLAKCMVLIVKSRLIAYLAAGFIMVFALLSVTGFFSYTISYLNSVGVNIGEYHISVLSLIKGLIILVLVFWGAGLSSRTLESYLRRSSALSYNARELAVKFFRVFVYFLALMITLSVLGVDLTAFAVFGGALGVGVGLGLQKLTSNFISGITLLMEKSIRIGDMIEVAGHAGWVRQLNIRYTLVETQDGKEIMIPNEELVSTHVINWSHSTSRVRVDIPVGVSYDSDPLRVRRILLETAKQHPLCMKDPEPSCWLMDFADSSLQFLLVFWIENVHEGRYGPRSEVMMAIFERFRKEGIEIPFPRREVHVHSADSVAKTL